MDRTIALSSTARRLPARTTLNGIYEIDEFIADGGMGEVYRGHNIQTGDMVAIKTILTELSEHADAVALFRREASTLNQLQHEAIVRYYLFSVDPALQRAYLAMEYVGGPSLATRIDQGPLQLETVKHLSVRLAEALAKAHSYGVIHRDISPDNIILAGGDVRQAKLIDFGIARSTATGERTIIGGGFAGKYSYASPEQLGLAGGNVTGKSDVYSLGLVLAECLTGRAIGRGVSEADVVEKRRTLPDLSDIDPIMRPLVAAMLQPDPDRRPGMADVATWDGERGHRSRFDPDRRRRQVERRGHGAVYHLFGTLLPLVLGAGAAGAFYAGLFDDLLPGDAEPVETAENDTVIGQDDGPGADPTPPPIGGNVDGGADADAGPGADPNQLLADGVCPEPGSQDALLFDALTNLALIEGTEPPERDPDCVTDPIQTAENTPGNDGPLGNSGPGQSPPGDAAPSAPVSVFRPPAAVVGAAYDMAMPAFADDDPATLDLAASGLPPGLSFVDRGGGGGAIVGMPTIAGTFEFTVIATDAADQQAFMQVGLTVEPAATAGPSSVAELVADFDGGSCFHVSLLNSTLAAFGASRAPLDALVGEIQSTFSVVPDTDFTTVPPALCGALDVAAAAAGPAPSVQFDRSAVTAGSNLAGSISGADGRILRVIIVGGDDPVDITGSPFTQWTNETADGGRFSFGPVSHNAASSQRMVLVLTVNRVPPSLANPAPPGTDVLGPLAGELTGDPSAGAALAVYQTAP